MGLIQAPEKAMESPYGAFSVLGTFYFHSGAICLAGWGRWKAPDMILITQCAKGVHRG